MLIPTANSWHSYGLGAYNAWAKSMGCHGSPIGEGGLSVSVNANALVAKLIPQTKQPLLTGCLTASYVLDGKTSGKSLMPSRVGGQALGLGLACRGVRIYIESPR